MPHQTFTSTDRRIGIVAALATAFGLVMYVVALAIGLLTLESPQAPIGDPIFSILELLVIVAPLMVVVMVAVHAYASSAERAYSRAALAFMVVLAGITCSVHFVLLTVSRHPAAAGLLPPVFFSFTWPSVIYALDILAWDVFFGLSMLFAAFVFKGDRLATWLRVTMLVSGTLSFAGLIGVPLGDMQLRLIGVLGYAGISPIAFLLLALVFRRAQVNQRERKPHL